MKTKDLIKYLKKFPAESQVLLGDTSHYFEISNKTTSSVGPVLEFEYCADQDCKALERNQVVVYLNKIMKKLQIR